MLLCNSSCEQTFAVASCLSVECSVTVSDNLPPPSFYLKQQEFMRSLCAKLPSSATSLSKLRCRHLQCFFQSQWDSCSATHTNSYIRSHTFLLSSDSLRIFPFFLLSYPKVIMLSKKSTVFESCSLAMSQLLSWSSYSFPNFVHEVPSDFDIFFPTVFSDTYKVGIDTAICFT